MSNAHNAFSTNTRDRKGNLIPFLKGIPPSDRLMKSHSPNSDIPLAHSSGWSLTMSLFNRNYITFDTQIPLHSAFKSAASEENQAEFRAVWGLFRKTWFQPGWPLQCLILQECYFSASKNDLEIWGKQTSPRKHYGLWINHYGARATFVVV